MYPVTPHHAATVMQPSGTCTPMRSASVGAPPPSKSLLCLIFKFLNLIFKFLATVSGHFLNDYHLVSTSYMPGSGAKCFACISSFKFLQPETQRGEVASLRAHSCPVAEGGFQHQSA